MCKSTGSAGVQWGTGERREAGGLLAGRGEAADDGAQLPANAREGRALDYCPYCPGDSQSTQTEHRVSTGRWHSKGVPTPGLT